MLRAVRYVTGVEVQLATLFRGSKVPPPMHFFNWINRPRPDDNGPERWAQRRPPILHE
jgi:hypothetical protein